jgi:hypothetical protein
MKNSLTKSILIAGLFFSTTGCEKIIDKTPTHDLSIENALQSISDVENSLSAAYSSLRGVGYYGRNLSVLPDMATDNTVQTIESLVNFLDITDWIYTPQNGTVAETWITVFSAFINCNVTINNLDKFLTPATQTRVNRIKGQALALRAMVHFDLMKYFADNLDRNSTSPAIPYVKNTVLESAPATIKPSRVTVKDVYDNIYADLTAASAAFANIDMPINTGSTRYKIDLIGLNAIRARVALYAKDWPIAISSATVVIDALPLATRGVYPLIWKDESVEEVAFASLYNTGEFLSRLAGDVFSGPSNRSQFEGNPALFATFDEVNDVRFRSSVTRGFTTLATPVRTNARLVVTKFLGKGTAIDGVVDWKAFRTGEMFLIRAEARENSTQGVLALADLNTLRAARIAGFVAGTETGSDLTAAIALERRKELFMEGHRWFDLKRTTRVIDRINISAPTTQASLPTNRREWTWPIPQGERDANVNMTQNLGY